MFEFEMFNSPYDITCNYLTLYELFILLSNMFFEWVFDELNPDIKCSGFSDYCYHIEMTLYEKNDFIVQSSKYFLLGKILISMLIYIGIKKNFSEKFFLFLRNMTNVFEIVYFIMVSFRNHLLYAYLIDEDFNIGYSIFVSLNSALNPIGIILHYYMLYDIIIYVSGMIGSIGLLCFGIYYLHTMLSNRFNKKKSNIKFH